MRTVRNYRDTAKRMLNARLQVSERSAVRFKRLKNSAFAVNDLKNAIVICHYAADINKNYRFC